MNKKDLEKEIIDIHGQIEDELNFIIDVDSVFVNKFYESLDNIDYEFLSLKDDGYINLFNTVDEGIIYSKKLKDLLFIIRKKGMYLKLKKIKLLLRRKRSKKEIIVLLCILKMLEEFFKENDKKFDDKNKEEIKEYINDIKEIVKSKKDKDYIFTNKEKEEEPDIKTIDKIAQILEVPPLLIAGSLISDNRNDKKEILEEMKREEKFKSLIKNNSNNDNISKKENVVKKTEKVNDDYKGIIEIVKEKEVKGEVEKENETIKEVLKTGTLIGTPTLAATALALTNPALSLATAAVAALSLSDVKEENDLEEETSNLNYEEKQTNYNIHNKDKIITPQKESYQELIETLEEADIEEESEKILLDNDILLDDKKNNNEKKKQEAKAKKERYKVLKTNFENSNKKQTKEELRVREIELKELEMRIKELEKIKKEKEKAKKKKGFKSLSSKIGYLATMLTINLMLYSMVNAHVAKSLTMQPVKVKKL